MRRMLVLGTILTLVGTAALLQARAPIPGRMPIGIPPPEPAAKRPVAAEEKLHILIAPADLAAAPLVFTAKLKASKTLMSTMSMPPTYGMDLTFDNITALRGEKPKDGTFRYMTQNPQDVPAEGQQVIVLATTGEQAAVQSLYAATDKQIAALKEALTLPVGWTVTDEGPVSPWAELPNAKWPAALAVKDQKVCVKTGRPAALLPAGVTFAVEQVPAKNPQKWKNDYGDGQFKLTLKNTTDKDVTLPMLLQKGDAILWDRLLVVYNDGKEILPPHAADIPADAKPVTIPAGKSVSGTFNTLTLEGVTWPQGGSRVHFSFALADKVQQDFFYYFSNLHDPMRKAATKE